MDNESKIVEPSEKIAELEKILLTGNIKNTYKDYHLTDENKCRFLCCFTGGFFQKLASKKVYIFLYGSAIFMLFAKMAYLNATITTLEKRFQIPTQNSGIIIGSFDLMSFLSPIICHKLANKCRPRWISFFMLMLACHCFLMVALNSFYGPGEQALSLTVEYGENLTSLINSETDHNKALCFLNSSSTASSEVIPERVATDDYGHFPQMFLLINQIFGGTFNAVFETLASSYLDDNSMKSKVPFLFSVINFFRLMAPMIGYNLAAFCLSKYIDLDVTPIIDATDNRWLGAWWYGWIIMGITFIILMVSFAGIPKELPRVAIRRKITELNNKKNQLIKSETEMDASMRATFGRIIKNKVFVFNTISAIGSFFGLMPYFTYSIKYVEVQYRESAADSSFYVGTVTQIFSVIGTLAAGWALYRFKPSARLLVLWNIIVGILTIAASLSYNFMGCSDILNSIQITNLNTTEPCLFNCNCENAKYSPICGDNGVSFLTPCDAGCLDQIQFENGTIRYENCSCISGGGGAGSGLCAADCKTELFIVIAFMCVTAFLQSSSKLSTFLICLRCVASVDKAVALALFTTMFSYCAMIPSPILFGWIVDQTCIFWEQTTDGDGNCWAYDETAFRFGFNTAAAAFLVAGLLFGDFIVYRNVKHLGIFDDEDKKVDEPKYLAVNDLEMNIEKS